jgi:hypothetical protein
VVRRTGPDGAPIDPNEARRCWHTIDKSDDYAEGYEKGWKDNYSSKEMWNLFFFVSGSLIGLLVGSL